MTLSIVTEEEPVLGDVVVYKGLLFCDDMLLAMLNVFTVIFMVDKVCKISGKKFVESNY